MAYTYLQKAFSRLSQMANPDGPKLCDRVSMVLSGRTSAQVSSANDGLNFYLIGARLRIAGASTSDETSRADLLDLRRVAQLVKLTLPIPAGAAAADADSWDSTALSRYIRLFANVAAPAGTGYYYKGSYWAYSETADRDWTRAAWTEATAMVTAGLTVVNGAAAPGAHRTLFEKWFGAGADRNAVRDKLEDTQQGMNGNRVGLAYNGSRVTNTGYREEAPSNSGSTCSANNDEWGYASPQGAMHNNVGFGAKFFNSANTVITRTTPHTTVAGNGMEVTRGGAIVHELTHRYARTEDVRLSDAVYRHINRPVPVPRNFGYGPYTCYVLAQADRALAVNNADSYRIFCEDAVQIA
jgi:hypothetical protein